MFVFGLICVTIVRRAHFLTKAKRVKDLILILILILRNNNVPLGQLVD